VNVSPRAKLLLLMSLFALPIAGSFFAYYVTRPVPTANYGELLLPPAHITTHPFDRLDGSPFSFEELRGRWILVMSDSGDCRAACIEKLTTLRQVTLALGRNSVRVARVFVVDDLQRPDAAALQGFDGTLVALTPTALKLPSGAANDRAHLYLVDPKGNVMMRWGEQPDRKRMYKDIDRVLKASQIG
jgi:hypothetical protein